MYIVSNKYIPLEERMNRTNEMYYFYTNWVNKYRDPWVYGSGIGSRVSWVVHADPLEPNSYGLCLFTRPFFI